MKSLPCFIAVVVLAAVCGGNVAAQTLEPIGGPYTVDANTMLLLQFNGNYNNAAATVGRTATAAIPRATTPGKISFFPVSALPGLGQSVRIDNSAITDSAYITVADTAALDMTGNWTIEAWVNVFTFGDHSRDWRWVPRVVMKPGDAIFWQPNYWLEMWGDNRLFHAGYYATSGLHVSTSSPNNMFVPGQWVHLAFIRDTARAFIACMVHSTDRKLLNFETRGFDKTKDIPVVNKQDLHIGWAGAKGLAAPSTDSWLDGFVDEVRISNIVRNFAAPPVIQSITVLPNQPTTASNYPVRVTVFPFNAGGSMQNVTLRYRADTIGAFLSVPMSALGNNEYQGVIPAQTFGKRVQYYVVCTDGNNMTSFSPTNAETMTPTYYSFFVFQPNIKVLDLSFEEGPGKLPVDASINKAKIIRHKYLDHSTDRPIGGGMYSLEFKDHPEVIDSNWVEADSPFLAAEEFTLDVWLKADSALHATRVIINPTAANDWNNANFELSFRNGPPTGRPVWTARYWHTAGAVILQDTVPVSPDHIGKWRRIILERNKTNGVFAMVIRDENDRPLFRTSTVEARPPRMAAAPMRIGRSWFDVTNNWFVSPYRGKVDEVKLFNYPALGIAVSVEAPDNPIPWSFELEQNYPNPFNPTTDIRFSIPLFQHVKLEIYDLLGRKIRTLVDQERHAGAHTVRWDAKDDRGVPVSASVYFYTLEAGDLKAVKKMLLVK